MHEDDDKHNIKKCNAKEKKKCTRNKMHERNKNKMRREVQAVIWGV